MPGSSSRWRTASSSSWGRSGSVPSGSPDGHVLYDLKYVLDKADSDLRL